MFNTFGNTDYGLQNITFNSLGKLKRLFIRRTLTTGYKLIILEKWSLSNFKDLEYLNIEGNLVIPRNFFENGIM